MYREQLLAEQKEVFGNADGGLRPLNYDDMQNLPILNSVIRETLRMHPPIHSIMVRIDHSEVSIRGTNVH